MLNTARSTSFCLSIQTNWPCIQPVIHKMLGHLDGCHCRVAEQDRTICPKYRSVSVEVVPLGSRRRWWPCADDWCTPAGSTWGTSVKGGGRSTSSLTGSVHVAGANILYTHKHTQGRRKMMWSADARKTPMGIQHVNITMTITFRWNIDGEHYQFKIVFLKLYSTQKWICQNRVCMLRHSS